MLDRTAIVESLDIEASLTFLRDMVRHDSRTQTAGERELALWMSERMQELGMDAKLHPVPGDRHNAIGVLRGSGGGSSLLFNGHLDTNPVSEGWTVDPWGGVIDDEFIYGIGVSNMKAGDAAYFCALKTLIEAGVKLKGDVILTFVVGELQSGIGTREAIKQGISADYFVNSEPTDLAAMTTHAGSVKFTIELTGVTRHMSKREEAVDAIAAACEVVPTLSSMVFDGARTQEHQDINRVNIGVIHGALGREFNDRRPPQVADFCQIKGAARYAPSQNVETVLAEIRAVLDKLEKRYRGLRAVLVPEEHNGVPPFEVDKNARIVKALNRSYAAVRGTQQPTGAIRPCCFFGTDAAHLASQLDIEGVVCGPGGKFNTMPDERVAISDYLDMIRIYMLVILDICEAEKGSKSILAGNIPLADFYKG